MQRYTTEEIQKNPRLANKFFYKTQLMKGFGYRYHFSVGEQFVVDKTKESTKDASGLLTNKVYVAAGDEDVGGYSEVNLARKPTYIAAVYNPMIPEDMRRKQGQRVGVDNQAMVDDSYEQLAKHDGM